MYCLRGIVVVSGYDLCSQFDSVRRWKSMDLVHYASVQLTNDEGRLDLMETEI